MAAIQAGDESGPAPGLRGTPAAPEGHPQRNYDIGNWNALARVRYYGAWTDNSGNATGDMFQRFGAMQFLDLAASYKIDDK